MVNKNPVMTAEFIARRSTKYPDDPLSDKTIAIRFRTSVDKKLRAIPEYSGLVRDCVDKHFDELINPTSTALFHVEDTPMHPKELHECYGDRVEKSKSVFLPQQVLDSLQDEERLKALGFDSAHHFMVCAITGEAKRGEWYDKP